MPVTLTAAAPSCAFYSHHTTPMCDGCSSRPQPTLLISYERFTFFKPKNILKDLTLVIGADLKSKACRGKLAQSQRMQSTTRKVEFNWLHELSTSTSKRMKAEPEMIFVLTCDNVSEWNHTEKLLTKLNQYRKYKWRYQQSTNQSSGGCM